MSPMSAEGPRKTRILVVDDHPVARAGISAILDEEEDFEVCGEAQDRQSALGLFRSEKPDVALLDISLGGESGLTLLKDVCKRHPRTKVVMLSMHTSPSFAERAIRGGAVGYVTKQESPRTIVAAIRRVLAGELALSESHASRLVKKMMGSKATPTDSIYDVLSDRQLEVLELIGKGMTSKQISDKLHRSVKTIETHRERIRAKLKTESNAELVRLAMEYAIGGSAL